MTPLKLGIPTTGQVLEQLERAQRSQQPMQLNRKMRRRAESGAGSELLACRGLSDLV